MINTNKIIIYFQYRYRTHLIKIEYKIKLEYIYQSNEIAEILQKIQIIIVNHDFNKVKIISNQIIIDYTKLYTKEKSDFKILTLINHMRLAKRYIYYLSILELMKCKKPKNFVKVERLVLFNRISSLRQYSLYQIRLRKYRKNLLNQ